MLVRMLQAMACDRSVREVGSLVDVDSGEAARLVAAGFAECADNVPRPPVASGPELPAKAKRGRPPKDRPSVVAPAGVLPDLPADDSDDDNTPEIPV